MHKFSISIFLVLLIACKNETESISPSVEKITESVYAVGYVKSKDQYQVFSKSTGILEKIWVKEGDVVKKGQALFSISNDVSKLNAENAQIAANNADYNANTDKLTELSLNIELSKKKMESDQLMMERQHKLWSQNIGTKIEVEQRELMYANSKATYEAAKLKYNELKKQLQFSSQQSKKNLSISNTMLSDFIVKSEVDGTVFSIQKERGEMISPQMPIALIGNTSDFYLKLQVDENDIVRLILGQKIFLTMDSYKGQNFEAIISKINPMMNEKTRSFDVEATFVKRPAVLYPNLTLEANIIIKSLDKALTIPRRYLFDDEYVYTSLKDKKKVKIGLKDYQKVEIIEGLTVSDKIYIPTK